MFSKPLASSRRALSDPSHFAEERGISSGKTPSGARLTRLLAFALVLVAGVESTAAPAAPGKKGRRLPPPHTVSRLNLERLHDRLAGGNGLAPGKVGSSTVRLVALRVEFPDLRFGASPPADELHDRFFYQNQFRYASQYFDTASAGRLLLEVEVPDVVAVAARPQASYGDFTSYDSLMVELTSEAIAATDPLVDFASYDGVLLIHAGPGQESDLAGDSPTQIWSGFVDDQTFREQLSTPDSVVLGIPTDDGGQVIRNVVILPEWEVQDLQVGGSRLGSLGVYNHEIGQRLGMIPLFDATPVPFPDSQGIGNFGVMGYGLWIANGFIPALPSAFNRVLMGWADPIQVTESTDLVLRDQERGAADSIVVQVPISAREYFLVSYILEDPDGPKLGRPCMQGVCSDTLVGPRRFFDFDNQNDNCCFDFDDLDGDGVPSDGDRIDSYAGAEWDFFLTDLLGGGTAGAGFGLLILHVDEQVLQDVLAMGSTNVNGNAFRKAVDVEEADGIQDLDRIADNVRSFGSPEDYFTLGRVFGPTTDPSTRSVNGARTGIQIELLSFLDSTATGPGPRARVRVDLDASPVGPAAPRPRSHRVLPGRLGSDLVGFDLGDGRRALVVPADSGRVLLVDADLEEAPVADGDPTTLRPWVTVPPALRGEWVGPPAVGDVDGDARPDVVLCAQVDSMGVETTRVFAWRSDGTELRDLDGDPVTNTGHWATVPGRSFAPRLMELTGTPGLEVVVPWEQPEGAGVTVFPGGSGTEQAVTISNPGTQLRGGPVFVRVDTPTRQSAPALAWVDADSTRSRLRIVVSNGGLPLGFESFGSRVVEGALASGLGPVRLVAADLDAKGADEIVLVGPEGGFAVPVMRFGSGTPLLPTTQIQGRRFSPLALADMDQDGTLEILVASESAMHVLSWTGAELGGWPYRFDRDPAFWQDPRPALDAGSPLAVDLDGNGRLEVGLHIPGGAWLVWDTRGTRKHGLERALTAGSTGFSPLVGDLDGVAGLELASIGRFEVARSYRAGAESLVTESRTELRISSLPRAGRIAWGETGGDGRHAFHLDLERSVLEASNDPTLASFAVGPNPAFHSFKARVRLVAAARVRCRLFNLEGQIVRDVSRQGTPGTVVEFSIDVRSLAAGLYMAQMELSTGGRRMLPLAIRR